jgi:hypothetical protein
MGLSPDELAVLRRYIAPLDGDATGQYRCRSCRRRDACATGFLLANAITPNADRM